MELACDDRAAFEGGDEGRTLGASRDGPARASERVHSIVAAVLDGERVREVRFAAFDDRAVLDFDAIPTKVGKARCVIEGG